MFFNFAINSSARSVDVISPINVVRLPFQEGAGNLVKVMPAS
jgi:hypothetical protein